MGKVLCAIALSLAATPFALSQSSTPHSAATARDQVNADAPLTWTDPATGLTWSKKDNGSDVNWNQASEYCSTLQLQVSAGGVSRLSKNCRGSMIPTPGFKVCLATVSHLTCTSWGISSSPDGIGVVLKKMQRGSGTRWHGLSISAVRTHAEPYLFPSTTACVRCVCGVPGIERCKPWLPYFTEASPDAISMFTH